MATAGEIAALRLLIAETDDVEPFTDVFLSSAFDTAGDLDSAAATLWRYKAAASADLVNVAESGSSRSLGDLHKNALAMAKDFDTRTVTQAGTRISRLTR